MPESALIIQFPACLPLLRCQPAVRLVQVISALAFLPLVIAPTNSATKSAVHVFTVALREQLKGGPVQVIELIPPAVRRLTKPAGRALTVRAIPVACSWRVRSGADEANHIPVVAMVSRKWHE